MNPSRKWVEFGLVKAAVSLAAVLEMYGVDWLKQSGAGQLRGRCPIHQRGGEDAFHASLAKNAFQCFYCGARGNVLDFVAAMEGRSIREAALQLQERFEVGRAAGGSRSQAANEKAKLVPEKEGHNPPLGRRLPGVNSSHPYLAQRGIAAATARYFGVGFYGGPGLMSGRIVIPIENELGRTVAYAGRSLDGQAPRYKLPVGFRKSWVLFNLHRAMAYGRDEVVVVEGFFDCMKVHQAGFASVVALMGATLSPEQEKLLRDRFGRVLLLLDGDPAGRRGATVIAAKLTGKCRVDALALPDGVQPDQLASEEIARLLDADFRLKHLSSYAGKGAGYGPVACLPLVGDQPQAKFGKDRPG